jgi:hypothetical protein
MSTITQNEMLAKLPVAELETEEAMRRLFILVLLCPLCRVPRHHLAALSERQARPPN